MKEILKNHKNIPVDCDEVLVETLETCIKIASPEMKKLIRSKKDVVEYYIHNYLDISEKQTMDFFRKAFYEDIGKYEIKQVNGAFESLQYLKNGGKNLEIVTARPDIFEEYTKEYIEKHFGNIFSNLHFASHLTGKSREKSEICKEIGATLIIEDNLDYALECTENGVEAILLEKPWNLKRKESHPKMHRVKNWGEIV